MRNKSIFLKIIPPDSEKYMGVHVEEAKKGKDSGGKGRMPNQRNSVPFQKQQHIDFQTF